MTDEVEPRRYARGLIGVAASPQVGPAPGELSDDLSDGGNRLSDETLSLCVCVRVCVVIMHIRSFVLQTKHREFSTPLV